MRSRTQRRPTRTEKLRQQKSRSQKKRWGFLLTLAVTAVLCGTVALAASDFADNLSPDEFAAIRMSNSMFAYACDQNEPFVADEKTSVGLCNFANKARAEEWNYVYGGKGQRMTSSLLTAIVTSNLNDARSPYLREGYIASTLQQTGNRATDCSGLVMNYMWWAGDASDPIQALCPSIGNYNANAMLETAVERGPIESMPEIPGLLVHSNGHVGIYIGGGEVIEARGVRYGVTQTHLSERSFQYWSKSPWIDYELSGIYDISGRWVFLDNGEDIGEERWVAKFVYGDETAGSTYVPVCDPNATYHESLPAVYDADAIEDSTNMLLVDRILAVIDSIPFDPQHGYLFEDHWYVILVDEYGTPEAVLNDPAEGEEYAPTDPSIEAIDSDEPEQPSDGKYPEPEGWPEPIEDTQEMVIAPNPVPIAPEPVMDEMESEDELEVAAEGDVEIISDEQPEADEAAEGAED